MQGSSTLNMTNVTMISNSSVGSTLVVTGGSTATVLNSTIARNTNTNPFATALTVYGTISFKNTISNQMPRSI